MIADPVKKWVLYWYEKLQIEAWARVKKLRPKSVPGDTTFENQRRTKWYAFGPSLQIAAIGVGSRFLGISRAGQQLGERYGRP
jgi:hypothetical protein